MNVFIADEQLKCSGNFIRDGDNFTYELPQGVRSHLDYFILSEMMTINAAEWGVIYEGRNLSDHYPVKLKLKLDFNDKIFREPQLNNNKRWAWNTDWLKAKRVK